MLFFTNIKEHGLFLEKFQATAGLTISHVHPKIALMSFLEIKSKRHKEVNAVGKTAPPHRGTEWAQNATIVEIRQSAAPDRLVVKEVFQLIVVFGNAAVKQQIMPSNDTLLQSQRQTDEFVFKKLDMTNTGKWHLMREILAVTHAAHRIIFHCR